MSLLTIFPPTPTRVLASDTFSRTTVAGASLGTMDSGQTWTGGTGGTNADGVQCVFSIASGVTRLLTVGLSVADVDQRIDWDLGALPNTGTYTIGMMARYADSTHHYRLRGTVSTAGVWQVAAAYINGGSETLIGSNVAVSGITVAAGTRYCLRARLVGSRIQIKGWAAASVEPSAWTYDQTDTTLTAAGDVGLRVAVGASTTMVLMVDNYLVRTGGRTIGLRAASISDQPFNLQLEDGNNLEAEDASILEGIAE